jgi:hypothetical protein
VTRQASTAAIQVATDRRGTPDNSLVRGDCAVLTMGVGMSEEEINDVAITEGIRALLAEASDGEALTTDGFGNSSVLRLGGRQ